MSLPNPNMPPIASPIKSNIPLESSPSESSDSSPSVLDYSGSIVLESTSFFINIFSTSSYLGSSASGYLSSFSVFSSL